MMRSTTLTAVVAVTIGLLGCDDPDNYIEGSITSQYDMSFDSLEVTQCLQSNSLHVEYIRGHGTGEEKPLRATITPTPSGPGTFVDDEGTSIRLSNSLASSSELPMVTSADVHLESFTPREVDSEISGSLGAMFSRSGAGDSFSVECGFKASLLVQP